MDASTIGGDKGCRDTDKTQSNLHSYIEIFSFPFAVTSGQDYYCIFIVFNLIHSLRII